MGPECVLPRDSIESETPGAAFHFENLAVLNQHLGEVLLYGMLLGHSQIPPFYIGRNARREIFLSVTCKGPCIAATPSSVGIIAP